MSSSYSNIQLHTDGLFAARRLKTGEFDNKFRTSICSWSTPFYRQRGNLASRNLSQVEAGRCRTACFDYVIQYSATLPEETAICLHVPDAELQHMSIL